jgi:hypothetical protein
VAVGERFVVAVQRATAHRKRKRLNVTACQLMSIEDGKIVSVRGHYSDQQALDDFWSWRRPDRCFEEEHCRAGWTERRVQAEAAP